MSSVKNELDLLKVMLSIQDEHHDVDFETLLKKSGVDNLDCATMLRTLAENNLIMQLDSCTFRILPLGLNQPTKLSHILKASKTALKFIIPYLLGLFSEEISDFIISVFSKIHP